MAGIRQGAPFPAPQLAPSMAGAAHVPLAVPDGHLPPREHAVAVLFTSPHALPGAASAILVHIPAAEQ